MHKNHNLPEAFAELGIEAPLLHALAKIGFTTPTEIQRQVIPLVLAGRDVLGQARTGTGKTAAFGLPVLQMIRRNEGLQFLVLVPTRELAVQVAAELRRMCEGLDLRVVPVYGGQKIKAQLHLLGRKPCVVVGTPGRVMDFLERKALSFDQIRFVVLDEVDRMLDIGFREDIRRILGQISCPHQTVLVSATLTDEITRLAKRYMTDPIEVNVSRDELTVDEVTQVYVTVDPWDKFQVLRMLLDQEAPRLAIVFCNTKRSVDKLTRQLHDAGIDAREIHGDLVQAKRERVMDRFRRHNLRVLVATDLAARGIDVQGISHIVNYDIPDDPHSYVHRIGRTARMGTFGKAISLVTRDQGKRLTDIEVLINREVPPMIVEGFVPRPPRDDWRPNHGSRDAAVPGPSTEAGPEAEQVAVSPSPRGLGAKFKPHRRRRL